MRDESGRQASGTQGSVNGNRCKKKLDVTLPGSNSFSVV